MFLRLLLIRVRNLGCFFNLPSSCWKPRSISDGFSGRGSYKLSIVFRHLVKSLSHRLIHLVHEVVDPFLTGEGHVTTSYYL